MSDGTRCGAELDYSSTMITSPVTSARRNKIFGLENHLGKHVRGQGHALGPLAAAILRAEFDLQMPPRFLLLGPTGVGKTETALAFTEFVSGAGCLERFDCSECQGSEFLKGLLGNRTGDRGRFGALADRMKRGTVLFDEIEKADDEFQKLLLQILEPGRITLACGEVVDLSRYAIVCTSNIASNEILDLRHSSAATIERHVLARARESLRPEIFNRFDETLVYRPLEYDTQMEIVEAKLHAHLERLAGNGYKLSAAPGVTAFLARQGIDRKFGARPLLRAIRKFVGNAVLKRLRSGDDGNGTLVVDESHELLAVHQAVNPTERN